MAKAFGVRTAFGFLWLNISQFAVKIRSYFVFYLELFHGGFLMIMFATSAQSGTASTINSNILYILPDSIVCIPKQT